MHRLHHVLLGIFRNAHHTTVWQVAPGNGFPKEKNPYGGFPHNQYSSNPVILAILNKSLSSVNTLTPVFEGKGCNEGVDGRERDASRPCCTVNCGRFAIGFKSLGLQHVPLCQEPLNRARVAS